MMVEIQRTTYIHANIQDVFNNARDLSLHSHSMSLFNERIISEKKKGCLNLNEEVAIRIGWGFISVLMRFKITKYEFPDFIEDRLQEGPLKSFVHRHQFKQVTSGTEMQDTVSFACLWYLGGVIAETLFAKSLISLALKKRHQFIKQKSEQL